jgi:tRNA G18 (ribose-2'-O)-methylase SpoU
MNRNADGMAFFEEPVREYGVVEQEKIREDGSGDGYRVRPVKWYRALSCARDRMENGAFLLEGEKAVRQIMHNHPDQVLERIRIRGMEPESGGFPVRWLTAEQFQSISTLKTPQGEMAVVRLPLQTYGDDLPQTIGSKAIFLDRVQDPGNVGTLIRTAVAFGFSGMILSEGCADPFSPKCVQASSGTVLSLWIRKIKNAPKLLDRLKGRKFSVVAADPRGDSDMGIFHFSECLVLVLGSEGSGLSKDVMDRVEHRFRIPIAEGQIESLNVAVSGAICMYLTL